MELMEKLHSDDCWNEFLTYKTEQKGMRKEELAALKQFVEEKKYVPAVNRILEDYRLSTPVLAEVNKIGVNKKRIVFQFPEEENFVLKLVAYLATRQYDGIFEENLFSFRYNRGVKKGINYIRRRVNFRNTYSYKVDIHDYFNSINPHKMIALLKEALPEEPMFLRLFENVLLDPYVIRNGETVEWRKGVMAGMPLSGFFANLYLSCMDRWFAEHSVPYIRYSDDVIVFAKTEEEIKELETVIHSFLDREGLEINERKVIRTVPGEIIEFLGFEFHDWSVNLARISVDKIKGKLHRKARSLYRWKLRKGVEDIKAVKAFVKYLNRKFYDNPVHGEITWARWYFPLLTEDDRLSEIDDYSIQCLRYIAAGNYSKKAYQLRYKTIQELGYHSLVNSFWRFRKGLYDKDERSSAKTKKIPK